MRNSSHNPSESKTPLLNCSWCEDEIPDDIEVFTIGAKAKPGIDLAEAEGKIIPLSLIRANKTVSAIVPTRDSPAVKDGYDLMFMVCSQSCAQALSNGLENDWKVEESTRGPRSVGRTAS
jgi:hypothetical protein